MMDADSIRGIPVALPPLVWEPQPMPSGDTLDGVVLGLDPATKTLNFVRTHIACGPSALAVNMPLIGGQDNFLVTVPGPDGMRGGLAAYVPRGVWNLHGSVLLAAKSGVEYVVRVWQGHVPSPTRHGIVSESAVIVGGGCGTWPGGNDRVFEVGFRAHMLQFVGDHAQADEILVSVYPKCSGNAGAALAQVAPDSSGHGELQTNYASSFMIYRVRGC